MSTSAYILHSRLDVLRGVLAAASNASKTPVPVNSDARVLVLLQKQAKSSKAAAAEFDAAKRVDLKAKEAAQLAVLEEYIGSIPAVGDEEVGQAVTKILANLKANGKHLHYGNVMRDLAGRDGIYASRPLNMDSVRKVVEEKIAAQEKKWF